MIGFVREQIEKINSEKDPKVKVAYCNALHNYFLHVKKNEFQAARVFKFWIEFSFKSTLKSSIYYYELSPDYFLRFIDKYKSIDMKYRLCGLVRRKFKQEGYDGFALLMHGELLRLKIQSQLIKPNFWSPLVILFYWNSISIKNLICTFFGILLIVTFILLPAPTKSMELFQFSTDSLINNIFLNHFVNIIILIMDLSPSVKLIAINGFGVVLKALFKLFMTIIFVNFIVQEITKRISILNE